MGLRPALPNEVAAYNDYQRQRLLVKPGMTCYWQTRRNRDSITFDEWVDLDLWKGVQAMPGKRYDRQSKLSAARLALEGEIPVKGPSDQLNVPCCTLRRWAAERPQTKEPMS